MTVAERRQNARSAVEVVCVGTHELLRIPVVPGGVRVVVLLKPVPVWVGIDSLRLDSML